MRWLSQCFWSWCSHCRDFDVNTCDHLNMGTTQMRLDFTASVSPSSRQVPILAPLTRPAPTSGCPPVRTVSVHSGCRTPYRVSPRRELRLLNWKVPQLRGGAAVPELHFVRLDQHPRAVRNIWVSYSRFSRKVVIPVFFGPFSTCPRV